MPGIGIPVGRPYSILPRPCHSPKSRILVPQGNYGIDASRARGAILQFSHAGRSVRAASICGINTCCVDPSPLQSLEAKTKTCVLSILKLYLKMLICGIYLEIWAMWSDKQLGISRRWL